MNLTKTIPVANQSDVASAVAKINRRAVKLGMTPFTLTWSNERRTTIVDERGVDTEICIVDATLAGEWPTISGWELVARIDRSADPALFYRLSDVELPADWRDSNRCDHCSTNRTRLHLFWLHKDGVTKLVGRACLRDFLQYDPAGLLFVAEAAGAFSDDCDEYMESGKADFFGLKGLLLGTAQVIREDGWVSRKMAKESGGKSTSDVVLFELILQAGNNPKKFALTEQDKTIAAEAETWLATLDVNDPNDYISTLARIREAGGCGRRWVGFACSIVSGWLREKGERLQREAQVSAHVGTIGQRLRDVPAVVLQCKLIQGDGRFGDPYLVKLQGTDGALYSWFASRQPNVGVGDRVKVTGTVKKHSEFRGVKETSLTRCSLEVA